MFVSFKYFFTPDCFFQIFVIFSCQINYFGLLNDHFGCFAMIIISANSGKIAFSRDIFKDIEYPSGTFRRLGRCLGCFKSIFRVWVPVGHMREACGLSNFEENCLIQLCINSKKILSHGEIFKRDTEYSP
jgi:hypothetical protein